MRKILSNQSGIALMMIMTSIIILMAIYGDFTFDSKISRLKATNIIDRSQAKLLAESGLQMAMTRLRLYKEAFNKVQSNPSLKQSVPAQLLNQLWEVPYMFPIPVGDGANRAFKDTVDKFSKESIIDGEIRVTVQNLSNRLNLNMLRIDMQKLALQALDSDGDGKPDNEDDQTDSATRANYANPNDFSVDQALYTTMKRLVDEKKDKDDAFNSKYGNLNYSELFTNLKYYMSDFGTNNRDPLFGEAEQTFQRLPMTPKFGPMTSVGELYAVPGWDDQLIELIQNEFSVYPTTQIDLNKITSNFLKILVPSMTDDDVKEFFLYRDNTDSPKFFNSIADFKKYIVEQERLVSDTDFDRRVEMFQKKGISFGSNPNLFKVICEGISNRSTYTLVATVILPTQEPVKPAAAPGAGGTPPVTKPDPAAGGAGQPAQSAQLMEPRIIEIQVN